MRRNVGAGLEDNLTRQQIISQQNPPSSLLGEMREIGKTKEMR